MATSIQRVLAVASVVCACGTDALSDEAVPPCAACAVTRYTCGPEGFEGFEEARSAFEPGGCSYSPTSAGPQSMRIECSPLKACLGGPCAAAQFAEGYGRARLTFSNYTCSH